MALTHNGTDYIQGISGFNTDRRLLNNFSMDRLLKEFGLYTEEISEIMKQYDNIDEVIDGLGDCIVFSVGTLLKLNGNDVNRTKLLINNVGYSLFVDEDPDSKLKTKEGFLKLATNELYGDIDGYDNTIEVITGAKVTEVFANMTQEKMVAFITSDILEKISKFARLLAISNVETSDDKTIMEIYVAGIVVISLIYINVFKYNPFIVLDEILKQINSRVGEYDSSLGKWVKDKNQDPKTLYSADFNKAKLSED